MELTDDSKSDPEWYLKVSIKIREIVGTADTKKSISGCHLRPTIFGGDTDA
jgi:hypothetical protein